MSTTPVALFRITKAAGMTNHTLVGTVSRVNGTKAAYITWEQYPGPITIHAERIALGELSSDGKTVHWLSGEWATQTHKTTGENLTCADCKHDVRSGHAVNCKAFKDPWADIARD